MFTSKAFHFTSAALVALVGAAGTFAWGDILSPTTAAEIVTGIGMVKAVLALIAPQTVPVGTPANGIAA